MLIQIIFSLIDYIKSDYKIFIFTLFNRSTINVILIFKNELKLIKQIMII